MKNTLITAVIVAIVCLGAGYFIGKSLNSSQVSVAASPTGTTFATPKLAIAVISLATPGANGTSTSILNSSANDYYVNNVRAACEGIGTSKTAYTGTGLAALTFAIATSSTSAPATNSNTNYVGGIAFTVSTSTTTFELSSSTAAAPGTSITNVIWASGSYMTITANATNTAACTVGVEYFSS